MTDADTLWNAFHADPAGTYEALGRELQQAGFPVTDPRYEQMLESWQREQELRAYDEQVAQIVSDPANADIKAELLHGFVAAADGNFDRALDMYRAHSAAMLKEYSRAASAPTGPQFDY